ncbi:MAG: FHA domain-containing protein [Coriobacteriia bacterium]|nr:FHA domain-containing protein [Coriobacteriia bacterium]
MNLTRCKNGHFYDEDRYENCPHCGDASQAENPTQTLIRDDTLTVAVTSGDIDDMQTQSFTEGSLSDAVNRATAPVDVDSSGDLPTLNYYNEAIGENPVVGWLVCVQGGNLGKDYRLTAGRNFIGRSASMDIVLLGDNTVARDRHAIIVYDPKSISYLIQAGEAKELSYLNDEVVLGIQELKSGDVVTLGNTKLMFFPCMSSEFNWEKIIDTAKED